MSRLAEDIELLERAATIAGEAIWPQSANVSVPPETLEHLCQWVEARAGLPAEYRLIDVEAVWLLQAAKRVTLERLDGNEPKIQRWTRLAELLRASIALDLVNAKKSAGEVG